MNVLGSFAPTLFVIGIFVVPVVLVILAMLVGQRLRSRQPKPWPTYYAADPGSEPDVVVIDGRAAAYEMGAESCSRVVNVAPGIVYGETDEPVTDEKWRAISGYEHKRS